MMSYHKNPVFLAEINGNDVHVTAVVIQKKHGSIFNYWFDMFSKMFQIFWKYSFKMVKSWWIGSSDAINRTTFQYMEFKIDPSSAKYDFQSNDWEDWPLVHL